MNINIFHVIGIILTFLMVAGVGVYSGSRVKNVSDFTTGGGKAGTFMVSGALMGSVISGQATIGTAQLAFSFGMSAWWFTLGIGIGCLILALCYVNPLRKSGSITILQIISKEYGEATEYVGSVLSSIGIFISIISQVIACSALLTSITPLNLWQSALIAILLMSMYVLFGGAWGAGMGGILKMLLVYFSCVIGFVFVMYLSGGFSGLTESLRTVMTGTSLGSLYEIQTDTDVAQRFFSLLARGPFHDIGSCLSLVLGILSTQTYAQAIWSAKSNKAARHGTLITAFFTPPIGVACTLIGLFMRNHYLTTDEIQAMTAAGLSIPEGMKELADTSQVFPVFIIDHMPSLLAGFILGTLLLAVVGGGAGLSLGVATILVKDIINKFVTYKNKTTAAVKEILITRLTITLILCMAALMAIILPGSFINDFGFLSMGLRGAVVFIPLTCALFFKNHIDHRCILASMILGPFAVLAGRFMNLPFDSLFLGVACCIVCALTGAVVKKLTSNTNGFHLR